MKKTLKREISLTDHAYSLIEEMIVTAKLKPGQDISESELSSALQIGRTPVREALKRLEATHAIEIIPRRGIHIRMVSVEELLQQLEPRKVLEELAVKRACRYAFVQEREMFLAMAAEYRHLTSEWLPAETALKVDDEFNHLLCQATRNMFLEEILPPMHLLARRQYYLNYFIDKDLTAKVNLSHAKLMERIAAGEESKALRELDELFDNLHKFNSISLSTWLPL